MVASSHRAATNQPDSIRKHTPDPAKTKESINMLQSKALGTIPRRSPILAAARTRLTLMELGLLIVTRYPGQPSRNRLDSR